MMVDTTVQCGFQHLERHLFDFNKSLFMSFNMDFTYIITPETQFSSTFTISIYLADIFVKIFRISINLTLEHFHISHRKFIIYIKKFKIFLFNLNCLYILTFNNFL